MDRPRVICHMASSLDGRIVPLRWAPNDVHKHELYDEIHDRLGKHSWIVGRATAQDFAEPAAYPQVTEERFARESWIPHRGAPAYAFMIDAHGKIAWGRPTASGEPIVVILTDSVTDAHLAGLRRDGVGYIFCGKDTIDLALMLETIAREFGIETVMLEGGGITNGEFLRAGLIDEISLMLVSAIDGRSGVSTIFDGPVSLAEDLPSVTSIDLKEYHLLDKNILWLRYDVSSG